MSEKSGNYMKECIVSALEVIKLNIAHRLNSILPSSGTTICPGLSCCNIPVSPKISADIQYEASFLGLFLWNNLSV